MRKPKKQYPEDFKTVFGFATIQWPSAAAATLISNFFMLYLTDYSGIDSALGRVGFAAALGTVLLLIARVVDIVDDPLQAWIVDNSGEGRLGKYRKWSFLNIFLEVIAVICIFSMPGFIKSNAVLLCIWVGLFYLIYELGTAFLTAMPLLQKITYDIKIRTRISQHMRIWVIVILVPVYFFFPIVTFLNRSIGDISKTFSIVSIALMLFVGILSFIGVAGIREKRDVRAETQEKTERLRIQEVLHMLRINKPLMIQSGAFLVGNLVFALTSAIAAYFLKWYYCADPATGAVNDIKYAAIYGLYTGLALAANIIAPFVAGRVVKKAGGYSRATAWCYMAAMIGFAGMAAAFFTGILQSSPYIFITLNLMISLVLGIAVIPQSLLWIECADYAEYKTGRKMSALVNSICNILGKAQNALASVLAGGILIAVGYSVNSSTGNYAGDLAEFPGMIFGFGFFITVVPVMLLAIGWALYRFFYPITPEKQIEMVTALRGNNQHGMNNGSDGNEAG